MQSAYREYFSFQNEYIFAFSGPLSAGLSSIEGINYFSEGVPDGILR
jgi:hypothetical protein